MFEKILDKMREKVRTLDYVMTIHAEEKMVNDGLYLYDVENGILSGKIIERQSDGYLL